VHVRRLAADRRAVRTGARVARDKTGFGDIAQTGPSHHGRGFALDQRADRRAGGALVVAFGRRWAVHSHALQPATSQPGLQSGEPLALHLAAETGWLQRRTAVAIL